MLGPFHPPKRTTSSPERQTRGKDKREIEYELYRDIKSCTAFFGRRSAGHLNQITVAFKTKLKYELHLHIFE